MAERMSLFRGLAMCAILAVLPLAAGEEPEAAPLEFPDGWVFLSQTPGEPHGSLKIDFGKSLDFFQAGLQERLPEQPALMALATRFPNGAQLTFSADPKLKPDVPFLFRGEVENADGILNVLDTVFSMSRRNEFKNEWGRRTIGDNEKAIQYLVEKKHFVLGTVHRVDAALRGTNPLPGKSFAWAAPLAKGMARPAADDLVIRAAIVIPPSLVEETRDRIVPKFIFEGVGLHRADTKVVAQLSIGSDSIRLEMAVPCEAAPEALAAILFPAPQPVRHAELLPADTEFYQHMPIGEFARGVEAVERIERLLGDAALNEFHAELKELDRDLGFSFTGDLLPLFADGFTTAQLAAPANAPKAPLQLGQLPDTMLVLLPVRDAPKAQEYLAKWAACGGLRASKETADGVEINDFTAGGWPCAYALAGEVLYVSKTKATLRRALAARKPGAKTLAGVAAFQAAHGGIPRGLWRWTSLPALARMVDDALGQQAGPKPLPDLARAALARLRQLNGVWCDELVCQDGALRLRAAWTGDQPQQLLLDGIKAALPRQQKEMDF